MKTQNQPADGGDIVTALHQWVLLYLGRVFAGPKVTQAGGKDLHSDTIGGTPGLIAIG